MHTYVYNSLGQDVSSNYEIEDKVGAINVVARKVVFDIVFMDPPYWKDYEYDVLNALTKLLNLA